MTSDKCQRLTWLSQLIVTKQSFITGSSENGSENMPVVLPLYDVTGFTK